jgi:hypothetical protein
MTFNSLLGKVRMQLTGCSATLPFNRLASCDSPVCRGRASAAPASAKTDKAASAGKRIGFLLTIYSKGYHDIHEPLLIEMKLRRPLRMGIGMASLRKLNEGMT